MASVVIVCLAMAWLLYQVFHDMNSGSPNPASASVAGSSARHSPGLVWHDEFTGRAGSPPDPARWRVISGARRHQLQYLRPSNVALDGEGHLVITARRQLYRDRYRVVRHFTSGSIQTDGLFQTMYGRLEARLEIPQGKGIWPGFWTLGSDYERVGWPQSGEIDIMENLGDYPIRSKGSIHGPQLHSPVGYAIHRVKRSSASLGSGFHVYGVTWSQERIIFTIDGAPYGEVTPADLSTAQQWVFEKPMFMILSLAVGPAPWVRPDAATRFPARMLVDWVRVYR